jgi:hypothetical protein
MGAVITHTEASYMRVLYENFIFFYGLMMYCL